MILSRRKALLGIFGVAPAIVAAPSLMRVSTAVVAPEPLHMVRYSWKTAGVTLGPFKYEPLSPEFLATFHEGLVRDQVMLAGRDFVDAWREVASSTLS